MKKKVFIPAAAFIFLCTSCAPKLTGAWKIDRYETTKPGGQTIAVNDIGSLTLKKDGSGEKNIQYNVSGVNKTDNTPFGWHATGPYLGIESPGSDFSRTWIIVTNKRKQQKWRSSDHVTGTQILELSK